jgi:hypothetical protein
MSHSVAPFDIIGFFGKHAVEKARLMRSGEVIPPELEAAFDLTGQLDSNWVWVLDTDGIIKGVLIASPAHGVVMIWQISIAKDASNLALARLLRRFLADCRTRGMRGLLTIVNLAGDSQRRLADIILKSHPMARIIEPSMALLASPLPKEGL